MVVSLVRSGLPLAAALLAFGCGGTEEKAVIPKETKELQKLTPGSAGGGAPAPAKKGGGGAKVD